MISKPFRAFFPVLAVLFLGLLFPPLLSHSQVWAAETDTKQVSQPATPATPLISDISAVATDATLDQINNEIRAIYQDSLKNYSKSENAAVFAALLKRATAVSTRTDALLAKIKPYESVYQNFLDILGQPPGKDAPPEAASITEQRKALAAKQRDISGRITRLKLYQLEAQQLVDELRQHGTAIQQATLTQRFPSPLGIPFWTQLIATSGDDTDRFSSIVQETGAVLIEAFRGTHALWTLGGLIVGGLLLTLYFFCHHPVRMLVARFLPTGRIRPIAATVLCAAISVAAWAFAFRIVWGAIAFNNPALGEDLDTLADMVASQVPLCGFVIELGISLLASKPEWRVFPMPDKVAHNLRLFPIWFAVALIVRGVLRYVDTKSGLSILPVQLLDGLYTLAVSPLLFAIPRQLRISAEEGSGSHPTVAPFLRTIAMTISIVCWLAVLSGYIPLAYTIISWVSVMAITMTALLLLALLATALGSSVFPSHGPIGQHLVQLGLAARLVDQASVVIPGLISVFLLVVAFSVATAGADFDPTQVGNRILFIFRGQNGASTEGSFNISLDTILLCAVLPIIGHYAIRILKNWFRQRFFPTTRLDIGAQASILSIITYSAWILVGLSMASALGVTMKSMTWVVSALSVGIGFGLQSIVQNFVSGIILMAERPVSIGDVVDIAGAHGEVARISVRSTNIKLADGSTMIVPNSQFITSAVRNATRAEKPGVFTLTLQLPFASDLQKAMDVMVATLAACKNVDPQLTPTVSISSVTDGSALLTGTARARTGLDPAAVRSEALYDLWQAFQNNHIPITVPTSLAATNS
ncbi:mechanosensitive ion channel protein MscS [Acetobacter senegalensis]|uniref:Mechanosensitive ion channel protein MscS n=2 Tax=Acetobacter TaxID=434 RepID=A0A252EI95_9PROT|nr:MULTISPECIES: DUF3772 domain-containing protein [Acetobacter]ATJ92087.1 DUF3772 domain-containing protein [Acetobacter tropicalis]OUL66188.1 mechanosensitive ion channel protein MscS [Acetobacter senegalensis]